MRTTICIVLAIIALAGPHKVSSAIRSVLPPAAIETQSPTVAPDAGDLSAVAAKVATMTPHARFVWSNMFSACAAALRADSAAEPVVLKTLDSMRRFHLAVGRFAWHAVGGNSSDPELAHALEAIFAARFGDSERVLTTADREQLAATYDALSALAK